MGRQRKLELQVFRLSEPKEVQAVPEEAEGQLLQPIQQNNNFYRRKRKHLNQQCSKSKLYYFFAQHI
jgi:hypothetical protein